MCFNLLHPKTLNWDIALHQLSASCEFECEWAVCFCGSRTMNKSFVRIVWLCVIVNTKLLPGNMNCEVEKGKKLSMTFAAAKWPFRSKRTQYFVRKKLIIIIVSTQISYEIESWSGPMGWRQSPSNIMRFICDENHTRETNEFWRRRWMENKNQINIVALILSFNLR